MTIFGISVGTSSTGVCILKDGVLLDRQVYHNHRAWSDQKPRLIVNWYRQFILRNRPDAVIVKIPPLSKHTKPLSMILRKVEAVARKHGCEFDLITKGELKDATGTRSTRELIEFARRLYPGLTPLYGKGKGNEHPYRKLFEAVLSAHIYQERQRQRAERLAV